MPKITAKPTRAQLRAAAVMLGRLGGRAKSDRKTAAVRENAKRPRPNRRKRPEVEP